MSEQEVSEVSTDKEDYIRTTHKKLDQVEKTGKLRAQLQELVRNLHQHEADQKNGYIGQVLTITDAALTDPAQRKAVKDLVHGVFWGNQRLGEKSEVHQEVEGLAQANQIPNLFDNEDGPPSSYCKEKYVNL